MKSASGWLLALLVVLRAGAGFAAEGWVRLHPEVSSGWLKRLVPCGDRMALIGREGLWLSEDGVYWRATSPGGPGELLRAVWTGDEVVVLDTAAEVHAYSDARGWRRLGGLPFPASGSVYEWLVDLAWNDGVLLATVDGERVFRSEGGVEWQEVVSFPEPRILRLAATTAGWVMISTRTVTPPSGEPLNAVLTSRDGRSWAEQPPPTDEPLNIRSVRTWGDELVALGWNALWRTADGVRWTPTLLPDDVVNIALAFDMWDGRIVVAGGWTSPGTTPGIGLITVSGVAVQGWVTSEVTSDAVTDVRRWRGRWIAISDTGEVQQTADPTRWPGRRQMRSNTAVASAGDRLLVGGGWTTAGWDLREVWSSSDGVGWSRELSRFALMVRRLIVGTDLVGAIASCCLSFTVIDWRLDDQPWTPEELDGAAVADGLEADGRIELAATLSTGPATRPSVLVGVPGAWDSVVLEPPGLPSRITRTPYRRVLVGTEGLTAVSADGLDWRTEHREPVVDMVSLASGGGRVVAGTSRGSVLWAEDGPEWGGWVEEVTVSPAGGEVADVLWDGERFLARIGDVLFASPDGAEWASVEVVPPHGVTAMTMDPHGVVAVTTAGEVYRWEHSLPPSRADHGVVVPVVSHTDGRFGTSWRSELEVSAGDVGAEVWMAAADHGGARAWQRIVVPAGRQVALRDVAGRHLGVTSGSVPLRMVSTSPIVVASRIANVVEDGSFGQAVPVHPDDELLRTGDVRDLVGLRAGRGYRSNLVLSNPGGEEASVEVAIVDDVGVERQRREIAIGPGSVVVEPVRPAGAVGVLRVRLSVTSAPEGVAALASVVDDASGDAATVRPAVPSAGPLVVGAVAHAGGFGGAGWRSDLVVANPGAGNARVVLEPLPAAGWRGSLATFELTLPAGASVVLEDVVRTTWAAEGVAALRLTSTGGEIVATSRTFQELAGGSVGQGIDAEAEPAAIDDDVLMLVGLEEGRAVRTNLGLVNPEDVSTEVSLEVHFSHGETAGIASVDLPPRSLVRLDRVLAGFGVESGWIAVRAPAARVLAWASRVDNASGDPTYVAATRIRG